MYNGQHNLVNYSLSETGISLSTFASFSSLLAVDIYSSFSSCSYLLIIKPDSNAAMKGTDASEYRYSSMDDCHTCWICCDSYPFVPNFENNEGGSLVIKVSDAFLEKHGLKRNQHGYFISRNEHRKMKLKGVSDLLSLVQRDMNYEANNGLDRLWITGSALGFVGHFIDQHNRMQYR